MDMSHGDEELLRRARLAAKRAYCDYSKFPVGATVLTEDGQVFEGCNIENASYGLTVCAERVALFNAVASGTRSIARMAVSCLKGNMDKPGTLMPCGACRQVMLEFLAPDAEVIVDGAGIFKLQDLLPHPFHL